MEDFKIIQEFNGHSGCRILLCLSNGNYFVRKISKSEDYNERLRKQMEKQILFYKNMAKNDILCPEILNMGFYQDKLFFDMEYINGFNLIDYIFKSSPEELKKISNKLIEIIELVKSNNILNERISLSKKFLEKINELKQKIPEYSDFLNLMEKLSSNLPDVESTFCHGDLTLENIMYDENTGKYYLIDFQDIFAEHHWFDISILFQDIDEAWYLFKHPELDPKIMKIKMDFIKKFIIDRIEKEYIPYHSTFIAMKFLRIIPYTKEEDRDYLKMVIIKHIGEENEKI